MQEGFWKRVRSSRLFEVLAVYMGASWIVLEVAATLQEALELPRWIVLAVLTLLGVGLVVTIVVTWVHSRAMAEARAAAAVEEAAVEEETAAETPARELAEGIEPFPWRRALLAAVVTISLLFGFSGVYVLFRDRADSRTARSADGGPAPGVAVLPFTVRGPEMEIWREGLVDLLSVNLDGTGVRAIDSRTVMARWRERVADDAEVDLETLLQVARATGAEHAIIGTAVSSGREVRLTADIRELADGELLRQTQVDGPPDSIIALVDRLSIELLRSLLRGRAWESGVDLAARTTGSITGLKAFLAGEQAYRRGRYEAADREYSRAVEADSGFALAFYRLGLTRGWTGASRTELSGGPLARADSLSGTLPRRQARLVRAALAVNRNEAAWIDSARVLAADFPDDAEAWYLLGELYYHQGGRRQVGYEETERAFLRAMELDPDWAPHYIHLVDLAFLYHADEELAADRMARYLELAPGSYWNDEFDIVFRLAFGDEEARRSALATLEAGELWDVENVSNRLRHPRFLPQREQVELIRLRRGPGSAQWNAAYELFFSNIFQRGWLNDALGYLGQPPENPAIGPCEMLMVQIELRLFPRDLLDERLSRGAVDRRLAEGPLPGQELGATLACGSLYAAYQNREVDFQVLRDRLAGLEGLAAAEGDSAAVREVRDLTRLLDGLGAWLMGDPETAHQTLADFPRFSELVGGAADLWWGRILIESGQPEQAIPYFNGRRGEPIAHLRAGEAYEALGRDAEAREAYEYFVRFWADADPELQPLVDEVRERLQRIAGRLN